MPSENRPNKVLIKLSGEAFSSEEEPLSEESINYIIGELRPVINMGIKIGIVIGGGNILRGGSSFKSIRREVVDYTGMLSTMINGLILYEFLKKEGLPVNITSGLPVHNLLEDFNPLKEFEGVMIFSGGTGKPFLTTDTASALRALQMDAKMVIKATKVDGVYDKDPNKFKDAKFIETISYEEALEKKLGIMDLTAFSLLMSMRIPICVINFFKKGNLAKLLKGERIGSLIK
uniref:Uridylate kinase n=1 Tax=candidate division WOR-3 bacterium TaxID=2052148 RepID=A0A7C4YRV6_UNCW3